MQNNEDLPVESESRLANHVGLFDDFVDLSDGVVEF